MPVFKAHLKHNCRLGAYGGRLAGSARLGQQAKDKLALGRVTDGILTFQAAAKFIFDGKRIEGDIIRAGAALRQRRDELAGLRGQVDYQVRAAPLAMQSATDQVAVARSNLDLANRTLAHARDRFTPGVTGTVEIVQAPGSAAMANEKPDFCAMCATWPR